MRHHGGKIVLAAGLLAATLLGASSIDAGGDKADDKDFVSLFNGKDLSGWKTILSGKGDPEKTFKVEDGIIVVSGSPAGYFYTDKSYKNYTLRYDWRFKRPKGLEDDEKFGGNSGLLVHIVGEHKVWPKCIEVQGENRTHANIFAIGGAKGTFKFDKVALQKARKPVGEWNTTEVLSKDGALAARVNGALVSGGKSELKEGPFGFQSEGAEIHFKNIKIKTLE